MANKFIKVILEILFFICLVDMPYGYYQFVRFAGLIGIAILAYQANQQGRQTEIANELALQTQTKLFLKNFPTLQKNNNPPTRRPKSTKDNGTETQYEQGIQRHGEQKANR